MQPYRCPICHDNRTRFTLIYKLAQDVQLDAETGDPVYEAGELEAVLRPDGRPDLEVRCNACNYVASENAFVRRTPSSRNTKGRKHESARKVAR